MGNKKLNREQLLYLIEIFLNFGWNSKKYLEGYHNNPLNYFFDTHYDKILECFEKNFSKVRNTDVYILRINNRYFKPTPDSFVEMKLDYGSDWYEIYPINMPCDFIEFKERKYFQESYVEHEICKFTRDFGVIKSGSKFDKVIIDYSVGRLLAINEIDEEEFTEVYFNIQPI